MLLHTIIYIYIYYLYSKVIEATFNEAKTVSVIRVDLLNCSVEVSV